MHSSLTRLRRILTGAEMTGVIKPTEAMLGLAELDRIAAEWEQQMQDREVASRAHEALRRASRFGCDCPERTEGIHYNECDTERPWVKRKRRATVCTCGVFTMTATTADGSVPQHAKDCPMGKATVVEGAPRTVTVVRRERPEHPGIEDD